MTTKEQLLQETIKAWPKVSKIVSTIDTETKYKTTVKLLDRLIDVVSDRSDPSIESLIDTLGTLVKAYEDRKVPEPEGDPAGTLKYLMEEHNLRQHDLPELGSQGVVSEILSGKRKLNVRQITELSRRFNVSPAVFI